MRAEGWNGIVHLVANYATRRERLKLIQLPGFFEEVTCRNTKAWFMEATVGYGPGRPKIKYGHKTGIDKG